MHLTTPVTRVRPVTRLCIALVVLAAACAPTNKSILEAIREDDADRVEELVRRKGVDLGAKLKDEDEQHGDGDLPLMIAADGGRVEVARRLLDLGAGPIGLLQACADTYDDDLRRRRYEIVRLLVARGAKPIRDGRYVKGERCVKAAHDEQAAAAEDARLNEAQSASFRRLREHVDREGKRLGREQGGAPAAAASEDASLPYCDRPSTQLCRAGGKTCEQCFYEQLGPAPDPEVTCNEQVGEEVCGARCCLKTEVCCVEAGAGAGAHCMSKPPGCVGWTQMRKFDFDRGMR